MLMSHELGFDVITVSKTCLDQSINNSKIFIKRSRYSSKREEVIGKPCQMLLLTFKIVRPSNNTSRRGGGGHLKGISKSFMVSVDGQLRTSLHVKHDDFNIIHITSRPFLYSNIPSSATDGIIFFLFHSSYNLAGFTPLMNVVFGGYHDFHIRFSSRGMSRNV